jgi:hypothetical protein
MMKVENNFGPAVAILVFVFLTNAAQAQISSPPQSHRETGNHTWADRVNLDDLVPYTLTPAAWSDRHSDIAIVWTRPEEPGIQQLESIVGFWGAQITDTLLSWELSESGRSLPFKLKHRNFRPDKIVESDEGDDFALTVTAAFPARNAIAVRFDLVNRSQNARDMAIDFKYPGKGVRPDWKGPFPAGTKVGDDYGVAMGPIVSVDNEPEGSWSTLYVHREHGRNVAWVKDYVAGMTEGTTIEMVCLADLAPRRVHLGPKGSASFTVMMAIGRDRGRARRVYREAKESLAKGWTPDVETARIRDLLRGAPELPAKYRRNPQYERLYAHAITGMNSLYIRGEGGYIGTTRIPYTTKHRLSLAFFWDTSFTSVGAREFDPVLGQEAIENFVNNPSPRGSLPGTLADTHRAGEGQAPIMCWAAWQIYQSGHDKAWLVRVYPGLAGYVNFWLKYHSSPRGLVEFFNAGQIGDNDARFDRVYNRKVWSEHGNEPVSGFESPDLNAFLVMDMRSLALMASELGLRKEAVEWKKHADKIAQLIVDYCYFPDQAMFYDVAEGTHEIFSGVKNPNMFLPLWAGVPLPDADIHRIVEQHMLNPKEFFRELPFPSLSFDNPKYVSGGPEGYWRGKIWPHFGFWMAQTLWRTGYHKEAELTADRLLKMFQIQPWLMENFNSDPEKIGKDGYDSSQPEYNWTQAATIELLLDRYKDPGLLEQVQSIK